MSIRHQGFTLVELAIVLVIIGMLVGGVLVGQNLIENAAIRATIVQQESYNAAALTFRQKLFGLPGDLGRQRAQANNLTVRAGTEGRGDGDSVLENGPIAAARSGLGHETGLFWRDLWDMDLIPVALASAADAPGASLTSVQLPEWMPPSKIRGNAYFHVHSLGGRHYYYLGGFGPTPTDADGVLTLAPGLSPLDAINIDEKLDDGQGNEGVVLAITSLTNHAIDTGTGVAGDCLNADGTYNADEDSGDGTMLACNIVIRAPF